MSQGKSTTSILLISHYLRTYQNQIKREAMITLLPSIIGELPKPLTVANLSE